MLFAKEQKLNWIEDASNFDISLDRNFLASAGNPCTRIDDGPGVRGPLFVLLAIWQALKSS